MLLKIIPVWTYSQGKWKRANERAGVENSFIQWHGSTFSVNSAKDILGVECYWIKKGNTFLLFDFSLTHLCKNQLKAIEVVWNSQSKEN